MTHSEINYNSINNQRLDWVDWAKTLLMFFIILCHSGISTDGTTWKIIFAFNVPGFFFISGYLYRPHPWQRTLKSFGIPILFFSVINLAFILLKEYSSTDSHSASFICNNIFSGYLFAGEQNFFVLFPGIWFIEVLFVCRLLMGDINKISFFRQNSLFTAGVSIATMLFLSHLTLPDQLTSPCIFRVLSCFPFMLLGHYAKEANWINLVKRPQKLQIIVVSALLYVAIYNQMGYINIWSNNYGDNYLDFFIYACAASAFLFSICRILPKSKFAEVTSKGTLLILGIHMMLIVVLRHVFKKMGLEPENEIICWMISIITIFLCYLPIKWCINHTPLLIGKIPSGKKK